MRITLLLFLFSIAMPSFSQTVIKLTHEAGPKHDYHYVNPGDTAYVFVYRDEDMGQWTNPAYSFTINYNTGKYDFPDGKYVVYINDTLDKEIFIKNKLPDSTWTTYYTNGGIRQLTTYKEGVLHGDEIYCFSNGRPWAINSFENGVLNSSIQYYESGCIMTKQIKSGESMTKIDYPDNCKQAHVKEVEKWRSPDGKLAFNLAYSNQTQSVLEIGASKVHKIRTGTKRYGQFGTTQYLKDYWLSGASLNFVLADHFVFAPKVFTSVSIHYFSAQLNLSAYTDTKTVEPVFTPEIGIGNRIGIRYGYNFKLLNRSFHEMGDHKVTIFVNLFFLGLKHTTWHTRDKETGF